MKLSDARKLHGGDEVTVRRTGAVLRVIETEYVSKEESASGIPALSVFLEDGNWYGYKEVK